MSSDSSNLARATGARIDAAVAARLSQEFQQFAPSVLGLRAGVLATVDGFELSAHRPDADFRSKNFAAMASSLTAISRAITKEVAFDGCDRLMLESASGKIVFQPVTALGVPCTVCIAVNRGITLGHTLWALDNFVTRLRALS